MANQEENRKITKYRRYSFFNIGTIIFGVIFIYMIICIILYATAKHITAFEVTAGNLSGNYPVTALAIKSEQIVTAPQSGKVTYYAREGAKVAYHYAVCTINDKGQQPPVSEPADLSAEEISQLGTMMSSFSLSFRDSNYRKVYDLKADMEGFALQLGQNSQNVSVSYLNQCNAPVSGFVSYSVDGLEDLTENDLSSHLFHQNDYRKTNLRLNGSAKAGDPLYKLATGENWTLYFPMDIEMVIQMQDQSSVRFRFIKDDTTFNADFSIISIDGDYYGKIMLTNSLARYVSDRYLDIDIILNRTTGLKIPTSAITEKVFYKIPEDYVITNKDTENEITFLRESFAPDGSSSVKYITATVYSKLDRYYLVSKDLLSDGDYIQMVDTTKKYQIKDSDMASILGVYNINKGYAIFREVTVKDENEEFCIIEPNNVYSLASHDRIVLDASSVNDDDIVL